MSVANELIELPAEYINAMSREDFMVFLEFVMGEPEPGTDYEEKWHLEVMAAKLEEVRQGDNLRLMINLPPRSLKTIMVSVALPAFILGHDPTRRIMCVTYSQDVAKARIAKLRESHQGGKRRLARKVLKRAIIHADKLELVLDVGALADAIRIDAAAEATATLTHTAQVRLTRSGHCLKLVDTAGVSAGGRTADPTLAGLLVQAPIWWSELAKGNIDIAKLSRREGVTASWMTRVVRLVFLAPPVVEALLAGKQPAALDGRAILACHAVDPDWTIQARQLLKPLNLALTVKPVAATPPIQ